MKRAHLALLLGVGCVGCASPAPPQPPPAPSDVHVYDELVEGGCLEASAAGAGYVAAAHASPTEPRWLGCLYDGGDVAGCGVPCQ